MFLDNHFCVSIFQTFIISIPVWIHAALPVLLCFSSFLVLHLSRSKWGIISLFIFPCSFPLLSYSTSIISLFLVLVVERESRRTCLFINVSKGSLWRDRKAASNEESRARERKCEKEKKEARVKERECEKMVLLLPVNWWRGWSDAPRACLEQQRAEMEIWFSFSLFSLSPCLFKCTYPTRLQFKGWVCKI